MWHYNRQWRNSETHKNINLRPSYVCWDLLCIQVCGPFYKVLWAAEKKMHSFVFGCHVLYLLDPFDFWPYLTPSFLCLVFVRMVRCAIWIQNCELCVLSVSMCLLIGDLRSFLFRVINEWCLTYWFLFCCFGLHFLTLEFWVCDYSLCLLGCGSSLQT